MSDRTSLINEMFKLVVMLENTGDFIFSQVGLTVKTYEMLFLIRSGVDTNTGLLNGTYGSRPNVTKKLSTLEENGFIERKLDTRDKRVWHFGLTPKGQAAFDKIEPIYEASTDCIFWGISENQKEISIKTIRQMTGNLERTIAEMKCPNH